MIAALKALFELPQEQTESSLQHQIHLAAAALLIETARADFTEDAAEQQTLERLLTESLQVEEHEVRELMVLAEQHVDEAISLYQFTRIINDGYTPEQKLQLISAMWNVAYADGNLNKYEEHLIRQVAELTYVPHPDYIRCKLAAKK
jgi:uncharacterized tellurite resistance protein B-like protein